MWVVPMSQLSTPIFVVIVCTVTIRRFLLPRTCLRYQFVVISCSRTAFSSAPPSIAKPANEPGLHHLGQQRIAQQHDGQKQPVQRRERDEPERLRQRRNRQPGADRDDDYGSEDERPTGPPLDERDLVGANDRSEERRVGKECRFRRSQYQ